MTTTLREARCPRCDSPDPGAHPAMQFEGEVQICPHPFHAGGKETIRELLQEVRHFVADSGCDEDDMEINQHRDDLLLRIDAALNAGEGPVPATLDRETIQTLLDLLNPLHGSLDEQTYDEKQKENFDAPREYEHHVMVTWGQEGDLTQAVRILEDRKQQATLATAAPSSPSASLRGEPAPESVKRLRIYIASKTKHAHHWRFLRDNRGYPVISSWIEEAGAGESSDLHDLWSRCLKEASSCDVLIVYREPNDIMKGAWVEIGAALASGIPVYAVGLDEFTIAKYRGITRFKTINDALAALSAAPSVAAHQPGDQQAEIERLAQTVDVLERNAKVQAKLLADTGRNLAAAEATISKLSEALEPFAAFADERQHPRFRDAVIPCALVQVKDAVYARDLLNSIRTNTDKRGE